MNKVCLYYMDNSEANAVLNKKIDKLRWAIGELYKEDPEKLMGTEENMKKLADVGDDQACSACGCLWGGYYGVL